MKTAITHIILFFLLFLSSCLPDTPATSSISIDLEGMKFPVNQELYGVTLEEINHAIDGGLYAEMVLNGSFEANVPPLNCPYDRRTNELITPNGYRIPFLRPDSIPGWESLSATTYFALDAAERINERNRRSLLLTIGADSLRGRGGVKAEGFGGMAIRKGQQYRFSFYVKSASAYPCRLHVALEDSLAHPVSDRFSIMPFYQWQKLQHTFTATADADRAVLTISSDSSQTCWIDAVSLMPVDTWKGRANGVRPDLAEAIAALHPRFVRFPGGSFVEGYTAGTYPIWHETIGPVENRRQFWNVWAYGSTNGMGYHEFLQFCEDVGAEPVYVINSGVTSQSRRPRYEDITAMGKLVQDALDALAYANEPADSTFGAMRAANGHPEPFGLKFIARTLSRRYGHQQCCRREAEPQRLVGHAAECRQLFLFPQYRPLHADPRLAPCRSVVRRCFWVCRPAGERDNGSGVGGGCLPDWGRAESGIAPAAGLRAFVGKLALYGGICAGYRLRQRAARPVSFLLYV